MNRRIGLAVGMLMLFAVMAMGVNETGNKNFTGDVNFDGNWAIKGASVTAPATNLNKLATGYDASYLTPNSSISAVDGYAMTNINAGNLKVNTSASAINGSAITNMNGANLLSGNIALARTTNVLITTGAGTTLAAFDGQSVTNLNGSSILSGSIPVERVTNAFASGVYAIAAGNLSTTGTVTLADGSVASVDLAGKTELASSISMSIATNANGGTNIVTFLVKDLAGTAMADQCAFRFFITDAISAAPSAVAGDVAISGGIELQEVVNKADYWVFSTLSNGTAIATITDTPGSTNFIHAVAPCGKISRVESQFNIP